MEIFDHFIDIEDLTKEEEKVIEIEGIIFFQSPCIFLIDIENNRSEVTIDSSCIFVR